LRPWRAEIASVPALLAKLADEPVVLVQSGLYPHAGYDERIRLLTPDALKDPANAGAIALLAPAVGAYPFSRAELQRLTALPPDGPATDGLLAVRLPSSAGR
jgi:hypothetical protein